MTGLHWWEWPRARRRLAEWVSALIGTRPYRVEYRVGEGSYCDFGARLIVVAPDAPRAWSAAAGAVPTTWGTTAVATARELEVLCARALAAHEAGHVLYTTTGTTTGGAHHALTNMLEDERVERLVARTDRRAAVDLTELGLRHWRQGWTPVPDRATRLVNAALYHRWDTRRPTGVPSRLLLDDPDEHRLWEEAIRPRVEEAWEAPDTTRVAVLAREILALLGVEARAEVTGLPGLGQGTDGVPRGARGPAEAALPAPGPEDAGEPSDAPEPDVPTAGDGDTGDADDGGDDEGRATDDDEGEGAGGERPDAGTPGGGGDEGVPDPVRAGQDEDVDVDVDAPGPGPLPRAGETDRAPGSHSPRKGLPGPDLDPDMGPGRDPDLESLVAAADTDPSDGVLWMQPFARLEAEIAGQVGRLAAELRVRTSEAEDEPTRARGRLDARAAVRTRGQRPLVRPGAEGDGPEGLAVLLLIDGTGSMGGHPGGVAADGGPLDPAGFDDPGTRMPHVRRAALLVQRACAHAAVPLAIAEACTATRRCHLPRDARRDGRAAVWLQRYETDPGAEGPRALIAGLYGHALRESVCAALAETTPTILARPEGVRLVLYIHDGQPDDAPDAIHAALAALRARGTVVLGLYLGPQEDRGDLEALFGVAWTIGVAEPTALPGLLGRVLARYRQR